MSDHDDVDVVLKRKKGVKNVTFKNDIIKKARVKGEEYINWKGNIVPGRKQGEDCRCKKQCFLKVPEGDQEELLTRFRGLDTKNEQDSYLQALIEVLEVQKRRPRKPDGKSKEKQSSYKYCISTSSGKVTVCKTAFINFHAITPDRVRRLCKLASEGKSPKDMRGRSAPGNAIPGAIVKDVEDHIASFPYKESHYSGIEKRYLNERLNLKIMHKLFQEKFPEHGVKYDFYVKIFHERFHLSFGRPQIDTCCVCEELSVKIKSKSLNDVARRVAVAELLVHKRRSKKFFCKLRAIEKLTKEDVDTAGICIDYMQNLQLPTIPVQEVFYLRQLTFNVFNIHNLENNCAHFYAYHEGIAKKGPNEVCSFLMDYINDALPQNTKHLHVFADNCAGQNKNHTMVRMFLYLAHIGRFETISQYFPVRGHSFLPCDRDFGVVKRKLRKIDRVYTPLQYAERIITSSGQQKFVLKLVDSEDILDLKSWWPRIYKKNTLSVESMGRAVARNKKVNFGISQYAHFVYSAEKPGIVTAYSHIDGIQKWTFNLSIPNSRLVAPTNQAYPEGSVPINIKKIQDLKKLTTYIPDDEANGKDFFDQILDWKTEDREDREDKGDRG